MCLLIFAHQPDHEHPLIIAANRDEFHVRPTRASGLWPEHPNLLAGKDLEQGGTWMGITREGRFSAITNYRDPNQAASGPLSRGALPLDFLVGDTTPEQYMLALQKSAGEYAGYNLLAGDRESLWYFANSHSNNNGELPRELPPGLYGLSNASLDTPWPKVELGKARLATLLDACELSHNSLETLVSDTRTAPTEALQGVGLEGEMAQILSAQFIITPGYGTRSTTTLRTDRDGTIHWREQTFNKDGAALGETELVLTN
ncbi:MAG: NRDE family protein [Halioglobus sp.]